MDINQTPETVRDLARALAMSAQPLDKLRDLLDIAKGALPHAPEAQRVGIRIFVEECSAEFVRREKSAGT